MFFYTMRSWCWLVLVAACAHGCDISELATRLQWSADAREGAMWAREGCGYRLRARGELAGAGAPLTSALAAQAVMGACGASPGRRVLTADELEKQGGCDHFQVDGKLWRLRQLLCARGGGDAVERLWAFDAGGAGYWAAFGGPLELRPSEAWAHQLSDYYERRHRAKPLCVWSDAQCREPLPDFTALFG